jgi:hypothetical protein
VPRPRYYLTPLETPAVWNAPLLRHIPPTLRYATVLLVLIALIALWDVLFGDRLAGLIVLGVMVVFIGPIVLLVVLLQRAQRRAPPSAADEPGVNGHSQRE